MRVDERKGRADPAAKLQKHPTHHQGGRIFTALQSIAVVGKVKGALKKYCLSWQLIDRYSSFEYIPKTTHPDPPLQSPLRGGGGGGIQQCTTPTK